MLNRPQTILSMIVLGILVTGWTTSPVAAKDFDVSQAGAIGDAKTVNTRAIQAEIDRIASEGGGTLVVPKGVFMSGALFFKPGVDLRVEKDGILKGTINPDDYPQIKTRWEGTERLWTSAFLNFDGMTHVHVSGEGTIDGSGDLWPQRGGRGRRGRGATRPTTQELEAIRAQNQLMQATMATTVPTGARRGRPRLICFTNCDDVHISDLHLHNQAVWCLHILYSRNVVAENLNILASTYIPSSDGIDIDSSKDVRVNKCTIACYDDNIAIKCGKDADGLKVNRPSEHITISDCTFGIGGGICMGSEISGSIRHVVVQRCVFNGTDSAARFKSQPSRGGVVEDVVFRDITLNNARQAFDMNMEWRMVGPVLPPANPLSLVHDIKLINFSGTVQNGGVIHGMKDAPIRDVKFQNCNISAQRGIRVSNAIDLDTSGLNLKVQNGLAIVMALPSTLPARN